MRYYSTTAGQMTLQADIAAGSTSIQVDSTAGLPVTFPYTLILDYGAAAEEVVDVTAAAGTTLTVTRGVDGTVAQAHTTGASIRHGITARDLRESREHEAATAAHGVAEVVGATETQTLDNKTFQPSADHAPLTLRGRTGNTEPLVDVRSPGDVRTMFADAGEVTGYAGSNKLFTLYLGTAANFWKRILNLRLSDDVHAISADVVSGATGRFLRLASGSTELFYVTAAGALKAASATIAGALTAASASITGNASVGGDLAVTGNTTGPLANSVTSIGNRVTAVENNLGSQTTFAATSATRDGRRLHWATYTSTGAARDDVTGIEAGIAHGAGFNPLAILITPSSLGLQFRVFNFTSTTFDLQVLNSDGSANGTSNFGFSYLCGE